MDTLKKEWSDEVQLRLRMTSEQINEQREHDRNRSDAQTAEERARVKRLFDTVAEKPWKGTVRSKPPYPKGEFHYRYHAALLRDVASRKTSKTVRRYWNRQAAKLEEKADGCKTRA